MQRLLFAVHASDAQRYGPMSEKRLSKLDPAEVRAKAEHNEALTLKELAVWTGYSYEVVRSWEKERPEFPMLSGKMFPNFFILWRQKYPNVAADSKWWRKRKADYVRKYRTNNPHARVRENLSTRLRMALAGKPKPSIRTLIGCSIDELKEYLQEQFRDGMAWNNYGTVWHVDHKTPCAHFDLTIESEQRACFNYRNLQPLLALENLRKGARIL